MRSRRKRRLEDLLRLGEGGSGGAGGGVVFRIVLSLLSFLLGKHEENIHHYEVRNVHHYEVGPSLTTLFLAHKEH